MATRPPHFDQRFSIANADGVLEPAALYLLYTYESGTTTPKDTFSDAAGEVPNTNPIELDAEGRCIMYLGTGAYTLALHDPDDAPVDGQQWDDVVGVPAPSDDQFVPIEGDVDMTGQFRLSGDATEDLNPVPLQQLIARIGSQAKTAATVSIEDEGEFFTGTDVEAALQELGATITPSVSGQAGQYLSNDGTDIDWVSAPGFRLASADGSLASRAVTLSPGTWQVVLQTSARMSDGGNHSFSVTQSGSVGATSVSTSIPFARSGGSGFGRTIHGLDIDVGTLEVATEGDYTMTISGVALNGATACTGSILTLEQIALPA
jgi:hypothetical protein